MGMLDLFRPRQTTPVVPSIIPESIRNEILSGRLPTLETNKIFLKQGEHCHFMDRAIYEKKTIRQKRIKQHGGYSTPGLFRGTRFYAGNSRTDTADDVQYSTHRGHLYITNKRIIFVADGMGFDFKVDTLIAITPYSNCVELQAEKGQYRLFVPDGALIQMVLKGIT